VLALMTRELIVAARRPAAMVAACGIAVLLMAFVTAWSPGVPVLAPMNVYEQTRLVHWVLLAIALPWTALRSAPVERGDGFVLMAALVGLRPGDVVLGKIAAAFALLSLVILMGLPALVIAQQAAAVPVITVLVDLLPLFGVALLAAVTAIAAGLIVPDRLVAWLSATAVLVVFLLALVRWGSPFEAVGSLCALAGFAGAGWIYSRSMRSLRYMRNAGVDAR
jgi:hypothetical protein